MIVTGRERKKRRAKYNKMRRYLNTPGGSFNTLNSKSSYREKYSNTSHHQLREALPPGFERHSSRDFNYGKFQNHGYKHLYSTSIQNYNHSYTNDFELPPHLKKESEDVHFINNENTFKQNTDILKFQSMKQMPMAHLSYNNNDMDIRMYASQKLDDYYDSGSENGIIMPDIDRNELRNKNEGKLYIRNNKYYNDKRTFIKMDRSPSPKRFRRDIDIDNKKRSPTPMMIYDDNRNDKDNDSSLYHHQQTLQDHLEYDEAEDKAISAREREILESKDYCVASLRYLLAHRMNQVIEANEECGILEEFIPTDYMLRYSMPLKPNKHGFVSLRKLMQARCSDIVKRQQLQVGKKTKIGYTPSMAFRKAKDIILERVKNNFLKLITTENGSVLLDLDKERQNNEDWETMKYKGTWYRPMAINEEEKPMKNIVSIIDDNKTMKMIQNDEMPSTALFSKTEQSSEYRESEVKQKTTALAPFVLVKMTKNLLRSLMQDVLNSKAGPLTVTEFLNKFQNCYGCKLNPADAGYCNVIDFLRGAKIEDISKIKVYEGETFLMPGDNIYKDIVNANDMAVSNLNFYGSDRINTTVNPQAHPSFSSSNLMYDIRDGENSPNLDLKNNSNQNRTQIITSKNQNLATYNNNNGNFIMNQSHNTNTCNTTNTTNTSNTTNTTNISNSNVTPMASGMSRLENMPNNTILNTAPGMKLLMNIPNNNTIMSNQVQQNMSIPQTTMISTTSNDVNDKQMMIGNNDEEDVDFNSFDIELLDKLRDLVKKHVVLPDAQIPLSRLPLLFCKEYKKVLNYQKFGYFSLDDLLMLLEDIVCIEDSSKGKFVVSVKNKTNDSRNKKDSEMNKSLHMAQKLIPMNKKLTATMGKAFVTPQKAVILTDPMASQNFQHQMTFLTTSQAKTPITAHPKPTVKSYNNTNNIQNMFYTPIPYNNKDTSLSTAKKSVASVTNSNVINKENEKFGDVKKIETKVSVAPIIYQHPAPFQFQQMYYPYPYQYYTATRLPISSITTTPILSTNTPNTIQSIITPMTSKTQTYTQPPLPPLPPSQMQMQMKTQPQLPTQTQSQTQTQSKMQIQHQSQALPLTQPQQTQLNVISQAMTPLLMNDYYSFIQAYGGTMATATPATPAVQGNNWNFWKMAPSHPSPMPQPIRNVFPNYSQGMNLMQTTPQQLQQTHLLPQSHPYPTNFPMSSA